MNVGINKVNLRCLLIHPNRFSVGSYIGGPGASMNNPVNEIITVNQQHIYI